MGQIRKPRNGEAASRAKKLLIQRHLGRSYWHCPQEMKKLKALGKFFSFGKDVAGNLLRS